MSTLPVRPAAPIPVPSDVLALGLIGAALGGLAGRRGGALVQVASAVGGAVLAAVLAPELARGARGYIDPPRVLDVDVTFTIPRPRAAVFDFFRNFENFPLIGGVLHGIEDYDDGRSRWRVMAPDGTMVEWNVIVTKYVSPRVLAWESVGDAPVRTTGTIRFDVVDMDTTQLHVLVHYRPCTPAAHAAFRAMVPRRPERSVRAIMQRLEGAMTRAEVPGVHDRAPSFPLPEPVSARDSV